MVVHRLIETEADLLEGSAFLAKDPRLAHALAAVGPLPLRRRPPGFPALLDAIVGQQVSTASANAIRTRLEVAGLHVPATLAEAEDEVLRAAGLSRQKIRYLRALSTNLPDFDALDQATDDAIITTLTALPGIGTWTAEIYLLFALGRADAFAPGDLALQIAAADLLELPDRPNERTLRALSAQWSPWRGVAARLLWAWYRQIKAREGI